MLSSQAVRQVSRRSHMYRRIRNRRKTVVGAIATVALLGVGWTVWSLWPAGDPSGSDATAGSDATQGGSNEPLMTDKTGDSTRRTVPPKEVVMSETIPPSVTESLDGPQDSRDGGQREPSSVGDNLGQGILATEHLSATEVAPVSIEDGVTIRAASDAVTLRRELTLLLEDSRDTGEAEALRTRLTDLNRRLVFSREVVGGDPFTFAYEIGAGDRLASIVDRNGLMLDWRFIMRINEIADPKRVRPGQRIKLIRGPFHAVISKYEYRMDIFMGDEDSSVYVCSFPVGLGEYDATPIGLFRVRPDSKLIDPPWRNPRTGELFAKDDPLNPIGEHWIGLQGIDEYNSTLVGYGIHGTIEPESIATQASMGCVRMLPRDVAIVYEMLSERHSTIFIQP